MHLSVRFKNSAVLVSLLALAAQPARFARAEGEEPGAESAAASGQSQEEFDPNIPRYTLVRPTWGVQVSGSQDAYPDHQTVSDFQGNFDSAKLRGLSIQVEYQPAFFQKYGILSFGPSLTLYPTSPTSATKKPWSLASVGAQIRYQARFFREQPLVPYAALEMEYWNYVVDGYSGRALLGGPVLGAALLLNWIDRPAATDFYTDYGISRTYLIAEMRMMSGHDSNLHLQGTGYFFGLRFEM